MSRSKKNKRGAYEPAVIMAWEDVGKHELKSKYDPEETLPVKIGKVSLNVHAQGLNLKFGRAKHLYDSRVKVTYLNPEEPRLQIDFDLEQFIVPEVVDFNLKNLEMTFRNIERSVREIYPDFEIMSARMSDLTMFRDVHMPGESLRCMVLLDLLNKHWAKQAIRNHIDPDLQVPQCHNGIAMVYDKRAKDATKDEHILKAVDRLEDDVIRFEVRRCQESIYKQNFSLAEYIGLYNASVLYFFKNASEFFNFEMQPLVHLTWNEPKFRGRYYYPDELQRPFSDPRNIELIRQLKFRFVGRASAAEAAQR